MRLSGPRPYTRTLRRLLLLPLMLAVAALSAAGAGIGRERPADDTAPQTWFYLRRHDDAQRNAYNTVTNHVDPSSNNEVTADHRQDKGDDGTAGEDCKSRSAGEDQVPCGKQTNSRGGRSSWLRHYVRAARYFGRRHEKSASPCPEGEVCLKEEMKNSIFHQKPKTYGDHCEILDESSSELGEEIFEISKRFCSPGSTLILRASLKTYSADLTGMLQIKIQCAATFWETDFIHSLEGNDGKKCYSWSANRNLMSFLDIIRTYVSSRRRRNDLYCFPTDKNNASCSDLDESLRNFSKSNKVQSFPKVVKGIKCRYDLVEGAVNDIGKMRAGCKRNCTSIAGRIVCSCPGGLYVNGSSKTDEEVGVVRHCKQLDPDSGSKCPPGYDLDADTMVCIDIDECEKNKGGCAHECENTNGGFRCRCRPGFFLMEDQKTCDNRDECAIGAHGRSYSGCAYKCTNLPNGFMCSCPDGYVVGKRDLTSCVNLKENITLTLEGFFYSKPTIPATEGMCPKGFSLDANNVTCTDIDECAQNISGCAHVCLNLYGGFKCKCRAGFSIMKDRKTCEDFDECKYLFISRCQDECENTEGSYRCKCRSGFLLREDQKSCEDIDECRDNIAGCTQHCANMPGSYKCSCNYGFYLLDDRKTCQDIDECRLNISGCAQECENTQGSFRCKCRPGYSLMEDQKSCRDIDECRHNMSECAHHCENTVGSYRCACRPGYFLMEDERSCDDRDECAADRNGRMYAPCSHMCINLPSGFMCTCPVGFVIQGRVPGLCVKEEGHTVVATHSRVEGADLS